MGVNINSKLFFSLLFLILLSISSVNAESLNDGDLTELVDNEMDSININDNYENSDLKGEIEPCSNEKSSDSRDVLSESNQKHLYDSILKVAEDDLADLADGSEISIDENDTENTTLKNTTLTIISPNDWKIYGEKDYKVQLLDEDKNPIPNAKILFEIQNPKGNTISKSNLTDEDGIAILRLSLNIKGIYDIHVSYNGNSDYNPAETVNSNVILYEKTRIKTSSYSYRSSNLVIKLVSASGDILANKKLVVFVDNAKYSRKTDKKGQIYIKLPSNKRLVKLNCIFSSEGFYEKSNRTMLLPVYMRTYTKVLTYAVLKGHSLRVMLKGADEKILRHEKLKITVNGKTYTRVTNKKGIASLKIRLNRDVYGVSVRYGNNSVYGPSYRIFMIEVIDPSGQFKMGLNHVAKVSPSKYFSGGGRAKVTKSIRIFAKKLTKNCYSKLDKALVIFNYVRNTLRYEYYPNTRKGASKTLHTKGGNCCDHANLIVALCRACHIPARYSHAQGCRFKISGRVEGHVWAQIYVGGIWYSADGTSLRNSLGNINNWDTRSYYRLHLYRNLPF